jgi:hypothetical protein
MKSIKEIPRNAKTKYLSVERVVWGIEIIFATGHVTHHEEKTGVFEMHIGVNINDWAITYLHLIISCLDTILS